MTQYTCEFTPRSAAHANFAGILSEMDGSPIGGLHPAKIGFKTEMLLSKPPTIVKNIRRLLSNEAIIADDSGSNVTPLAFNVRGIAGMPYQQSLLATSDGVQITTLALGNLHSFPVRDMDADHLWYVYEGRGSCYTDLGWLSYDTGDFIYIPKNVISYFIPGFLSPSNVLIGIQCENGLRLPAMRPYDNGDTPFNECAMKLPAPYKDHGPVKVNKVHVRRGGKWSEVEYEHTPFLCVAWKGTSYPFVISAKKLNFSYVQSIHPDPSNFVLMAAPDASAVVSVLGPRFVHSLPYNHLNEWDEFLFYAKEYDARKGSAGGVGDSGTATLHPQGIWHGPQMAAIENWKRPASPKDIPWVEDLAIMFETKKPLELCTDGQSILIPGYEKSWLEGWEEYEARQKK